MGKLPTGKYYKKHLLSRDDNRVNLRIRPQTEVIQIVDFNEGVYRVIRPILMFYGDKISLMFNDAKYQNTQQMKDITNLILKDYAYTKAEINDIFTRIDIYARNENNKMDRELAALEEEINGWYIKLDPELISRLFKKINDLEKKINQINSKTTKDLSPKIKLVQGSTVAVTVSGLICTVPKGDYFLGGYWSYLNTPLTIELEPNLNSSTANSSSGYKDANYVYLERDPEDRDILIVSKSNQRIIYNGDAMFNKILLAKIETNATTYINTVTKYKSNIGYNKYSF